MTQVWHVTNRHRYIVDRHRDDVRESCAVLPSIGELAVYEDKEVCNTCAWLDSLQLPLALLHHKAFVELLHLHQPDLHAHTLSTLGQEIPSTTIPSYKKAIGGHPHRHRWTAFYNHWLCKTIYSFRYVGSCLHWWHGILGHPHRRRRTAFYNHLMYEDIHRGPNCVPLF